MKKLFKIICVLSILIYFNLIDIKANEYDSNILSSNFIIENDVLVSYKGTDEIVKIPEGIIVIGEQAFKSNTVIKEVVFPSSLVKIGNYAFYKCSNLIKADFTRNLSVIGSYAFSGTNIEYVFVPKSLVSVEYRIFRDCENIKIVEFEEGITTIPSYLFSCSGLFKNSEDKILEIPATVTKIESSAFADCAYLEGVVLPGNIEEINYNAFSGTGIKELIIPNDFCSIGASFNDCENLENVIIKKSKNIENTRRVLSLSSTFNKCYNLKNFKLDDKNICVYFYEDVFANCIRLESVDFPANGGLYHNS